MPQKYDHFVWSQLLLQGILRYGLAEMILGLNLS